VWLGHHRPIRPPGLFVLYVTGYSAFRIFEEVPRIDSSEHFLGLRLNFYVAGALTVAGIAWFVHGQRKGKRAAQRTALPAGAVLPAARTGGAGAGGWSCGAHGGVFCNAATGCRPDWCRPWH
jgi:hypothetical protein